MPNAAPRAYGSQCGAPNPANAGTKNNPPASGTDAANASSSATDRTSCNSSRSHWITAPPTNTEPSSAYSVSPDTRHAMVVSRLFRDTTGSAPVFISKKHPVPYVFFAMPGAKHACPNNAAC